MLHFLAFFGACGAICVLWKRRFEQALPVTMLCAMLVLTALAMPQKLLWVDALAWCVLAAILFLAVFTLATRRLSPAGLCRRFGAYVLTPGFVCFALAAVFLVYSTQAMVVWWGDDIVHWALEPKALWFFNGLQDSAHRLDNYFASYTPGLPVVQWWMMHALGEWKESTLYLTLFLSYAAFLLPLFSKIRWKQSYLIPFALVFLAAYPVWGNMLSYTFLSVDTALALCFGYTLIQMWRYEKGDVFQLAAIALGLCGLVLIKQIGLLFALVAVLMMAFTKRCGKREWPFLLSPLAVMGAWLVFCQVMGLSGVHSSGLTARMNEILTGAYVPPQGAAELPGSLWSALTTTQYTHALLLNTRPLLQPPKLAWLALLAASPWLLAKVYPSQALRRAGILFGGVILAYMLMQYGSFLTVFYEEAGAYVGERQINMASLMERYLSPLLLGMGMWVLWLVIDAFPQKLAALWKPLPCASALLVILALALTVNWGILYETLLPDRYAQQDRALGVEGTLLMDNDWGAALEGYPGAHVLMGLDYGAADYVKSFAYVFAPARFDLPTSAMTQSADTLQAYLLQNRITHVICFDDANPLCAPAGELVEEDSELYPWTLYEVVPADTGVELVEYY